MPREAHIPAEQTVTLQAAWVQGPYVLPIGPEGPERTPEEGSEDSFALSAGLGRGATRIATKLAALSGRQAFRRLYRRGTRLRGSVISVVFARTGSRTVRLGFSVPGRLGGSVLRNRFKRQVREFVRLEQVDGVDLVVSPNGLLEEIACEVLREDLRAMAERIRQELPQGSP